MISDKLSFFIYVIWFSITYYFDELIRFCLFRKNIKQSFEKQAKQTKEQGSESGPD